MSHRLEEHVALDLGVAERTTQREDRRGVVRVCALELGELATKRLHAVRSLDLGRPHTERFRDARLHARLGRQRREGVLTEGPRLGRLRGTSEASTGLRDTSFEEQLERIEHGESMGRDGALDIPKPGLRR